MGAPMAEAPQEGEEPQQTTLSEPFGTSQNIETANGFPRPPRGMWLPRFVLVGAGVLQDVVKASEELSLPERGLLVADAITMRIAGDKVAELLSEKGHDISVIEVEGASSAELARVEQVAATARADFLLGVGGGMPIDLAKLASYHQRRPFISIPTAGSHDGIASARASLQLEGQKTSLEARPPLAIIADTDLISKAPYRLLASGCGDTLSNETAVLDWKLGRERGEPYSDYAASLALMTSKLMVEGAKRIVPESEDGARLVVKALISSGVAMAIAGSSRPASGGEHKFSHWLDANVEKPALHGEQCGVGAILTMYLHGGNWLRLMATLEQVGAPTTAAGMGMDGDLLCEALIKGHTIRPSRYTILDKPVTKAEAQEALEATGVAN